MNYLANEIVLSLVLAGAIALVATVVGLWVCHRAAVEEAARKQNLWRKP